MMTKSLNLRANERLYEITFADIKKERLGMQNWKQGFTMIEIMIVLAIIAILAATMIPEFMGFDSEARVATTKSNLTTVRNKITYYRAKTGHYPASLNVLLKEKYFDAGIKRAYLKDVPVEMISDKEGNNNVELQNSTEALSGDGGWTYFKDTAEVVIDSMEPLGEEWESYADQVPSEW